MDDHERLVTHPGTTAAEAEKLGQSILAMAGDIVEHAVMMSGGSLAPPPDETTRFLRSIREDGSNLPLPPEDWSHHLRSRTKDETLACVRCQQRAERSYFARTNSGNRWLDLCVPCATKVQRVEEGLGWLT